jgi:hypothetical protein
MQCGDSIGLAIDFPPTRRVREVAWDNLRIQGVRADACVGPLVPAVLPRGLNSRAGSRVAYRQFGSK